MAGRVERSGAAHPPLDWLVDSAIRSATDCHAGSTSLSDGKLSSGGRPAPAVKAEPAQRWPDLRLAFSRPGFLTFKLPEDHRLGADFQLESIFARAYAFSLGKVAGAVRLRQFRKMRWLTADMNVAPKCTLDIVESVVTARDVQIRGMLLTIKLPDWKLAAEVPQWLNRVRRWGYNVVRAQQLAHHRQEFCVAALRRPFRRGSRPSGSPPKFAHPS